VSACLLNYTKCLVALENQRSSLVAACDRTGSLMQAALAAAALTNYSGSELQAGCRRTVCSVMNSSRLNCSFGVNDSAVCVAPRATVVVYTAQGTFRLSGADWAELVNNPARRATLVVAVQTDLAALLGIDPLYVVIIDVSVGSLIVNYAILDGAGKSPSQLAATLQTAQSNTNWLAGVKNTYALVSNETIAVLSITVTTMEPSTPASNTTNATTHVPSTTTVGTTAPSINAAPATSVIAAAALALAAVVLAL